MADKGKADAASRLTMHKNKGKTEDEMRRRRNEVTVEIRKTKRDDTLNKKRNVPNVEDTTDDEDGRENMATASLEEIVLKAQSPDPNIQLQAVQVGLRMCRLEINF